MDGMAADDASPASAVRERYERMFKEKQRGPSKGLVGVALPGDPAAAALAAQGQAVRTAFQGSISSVFTKHLRYAPHIPTSYTTLSQGTAAPLQLSTSRYHLDGQPQVIPQPQVTTLCDNLLTSYLLDSSPHFTSSNYLFSSSNSVQRRCCTNMPMLLLGYATTSL